MVRRSFWLLLVVLALCVPLVASAQERDVGCSILSAGNDIYTIYTWEEPGNSAERGDACPVGSYGVVTGPEHPSGEGLDLLQDGANPATSFNTVLDVGQNTAYVLSDGSTIPAAQRGGESPVALAGLGDADVVNATTLSITFDTSSLKGAHSLEIVVEIQVFGTTLDDSEVRVQTKVENLAEKDLGRGAADAVSIAIRHLWDFAIDGVTELDLGPEISVYPDSNTFIAELAFFLGSNMPAYYEMSANQGFQYYSAYGSGTDRLSGGVADRGGVTVPPTQLHYICAPLAAAAPFYYNAVGQIVGFQDLDCSPSETGDSGVVYYWMQEPANAGRTPLGIVLDGGESYTVESWLWSYGNPPQPPELCLTLELDATQVNGNLGVPGLQNNDVVCGEGVLDEPMDDLVRGAEEDAFELFFDGSDVGITRTIIDGLDILDAPDISGADRGKEEIPVDILLSFNQAHSIPPLGLVLQSDIIRFSADENGTSTDGDFERFFDGSDIGLTAGGEDIDAFVFDEHFITGDRGMSAAIGDLLFSTSGNLNIPGLSAQDEDIVICWGYRYTPGAGGDINSSCEDIELFFDGTAAGLANASEDVDAFSLGGSSVRGLSSNILYLSTKGNFSIDTGLPPCTLEGDRACADRGALTVSGRNEDVFRCLPGFEQWSARGVPLPISSCAYVDIVFDGSDYGLRNNNVFSIDIRWPFDCLDGTRGFCAAREQ